MEARFEDIILIQTSTKLPKDNGPFGSLYGKEYAIWNHSPNNMTISQEYNEFKNEYQLLTLPAPKLSDTIFDGIELSNLGEIMQEYTPPQNQQPDLRKRLYFQNIESENLALADVTGSIVYRLSLIHI